VLSDLVVNFLAAALAIEAIVEIGEDSEHLLLIIHLKLLAITRRLVLLRETISLAILNPREHQKQIALPLERSHQTPLLTVLTRLLSVLNVGETTIKTTAHRITTTITIVLPRLTIPTPRDETDLRLVNLEDLELPQSRIGPSLQSTQ
jgi:hypothetical protein